MRIMSDLEDGNSRIEFGKGNAIVIDSTEKITIICEGTIIKTLSFNELTNALKSHYLIY